MVVGKLNGHGLEGNMGEGMKEEGGKQKRKKKK